jgi:hypothetical protein
VMTSGREGGQIGRIAIAKPGDLRAMLRFVLQEVVKHPVGRGIVRVEMPDAMEFVVRHRAQSLEQVLPNLAQTLDMDCDRHAVNLDQPTAEVAVGKRQE